MDLRFMGACKEVGRSCIIVGHNNRRVLLDAGVSLSGSKVSFPEDFDASSLDSLILSHAHLDHTGFSPALYKRGFTGKNYCTPVTTELSKILLEDFLHIQHEHKQNARFEEKDLRRFLSSNVRISYHSPTKVAPGVFAEMKDAGHIPGSSSVMLKAGEERLLYTGDIRTSDTELLYGADTDFPEIDYMITESTYAQREHPDRQDTEKEFIKSLEQGVDRGTVIVPVFAVGRAQEILCVLDKYDFEAPMYIDGMAKDVSMMMAKHELRGRELLDNGLARTNFVHNRRKIDFSNSVILTTAGMLNGGPVISYMERYAFDEDNSVLLTGYQVEETGGRELIENNVFRGEKVKATVKQFDFSAHSDGREMLELVKKAAPKQCFCIHGSESSCQKFANEIRDKLGIETHAPDIGQSYKL